MNKVIIIGRLTRDVETRQAGETSVSNYSIAVDRRFKRDGEPTADFFDCVAFGKSAEFAEKYFHKGTKIAVVGHLQNDSYTNKDGQKVTRTKIYVDETEFAESKAASQDTRTGSDGFMDIPDGTMDDLPFA